MHLAASCAPPPLAVNSDPVFSIAFNARSGIALNHHATVRADDLPHEVMAVRC
jgi:hypothetical protein